jgi:hypothetical protein
MRSATVGLFFSAAGLCLFSSAAAANPEPAPEVKWSKGIADNFWKAVLTGQAEQAAGLLSPELSKSLVTHQWVGSGAAERVVDFPASKWLRQSLPEGPEVIVTFDAEELAPDKTEVVFRGRLTGKTLGAKRLSSDFTMRVARESAAGKWSIRLILVTERKDGENKLP